ncbi:MAG: hypothetical protein Q7W02_16590 [Candidatus Rokubacteria bacterium]|nr:hypothetical protein [Candidatus Rokubacteria bacterium]
MSRLVPEIHVHLVAAISNGLIVEYMPWTLRLFEETPGREAVQESLTPVDALFVGAVDRRAPLAAGAGAAMKLGRDLW